MSNRQCSRRYGTIGTRNDDDDDDDDNDDDNHHHQLQSVRHGVACRLFIHLGWSCDHSGYKSVHFLLSFFQFFAVLVISKQTVESSFETVHRAGSYYVLRQRVPHIDNLVTEEICTDPAFTITFFKLQTMSTSCRSRSSVAWKYICIVHFVNPIYVLVYFNDVVSHSL